MEVSKVSNVLLLFFLCISILNGKQFNTIQDKLYSNNTNLWIKDLGDPHYGTHKLVRSKLFDEEEKERFDEVDIEWSGRVVALGDVHGDFNSVFTILYLSGIIDTNLNWIANNTLLIQMGDVVDRGHHGLRIYKLFYNLSFKALEKNSRLIQLLGNHEIMNLCGQLQYVTDEDFDSYGGKMMRQYEWSKHGFIGKYLRNLNIAIKVNDTIYVHAGLVPKYARMGLEEIAKLAHELLKHSICDISPNSLFYDEDGPLWTRNIAIGSHNYSCKLLEESLKYLNAKRMVIGHTIQPNGRINVRCNQQLFLVDTGISDAIMGKPTLLELMYSSEYQDIDKKITDFKGKEPFSINELLVKEKIIEGKRKVKYIEINNILNSLIKVNDNCDEL
ncbi:serine threonine protein phosphatase [Cryptosporidium andersoni]|uniref:Serine threonine protein phosphatase n=1 Tax=Cryptosporidium andersoni TaxID=117008 RepID=A0A1J4MVU1_9CRYT|nr:serine threonine protein phosphatase [Cryptosporidium andersoni]